MRKNYEKENETNLFDLLKYPDMRIRQKAQFELVNRRKSQLLINAIAQKEDKFMRIHGIWGLGQLIAKGEDLAYNLILYLSDEDGEIIAQTAKVLGDVKFTEAGSLDSPAYTQKLKS